MNPFNFSRIPELFFGAGKLSLLPGLLEKQGKHLLLVTGKGSFSETPQATYLFEELSSKGLQWSVYQVTSEPSAGIIDQAVDLYRNNRPDVVVAIGGGSVMDAGKAISAMLASPEKTIRYLEVVGDLNPTGEKVPFIAIPTTAGTGSEATKNAVISKVGENGYKCSLRHNNYVPDVALIDPELQRSCPPALTACSGMDAFTQLLESYLSTQASPMTDALAIDGITNVSESLVQLINHPDDVELRSKMAYAAWLSGITLANAGLGTVHGFAGTIGAMFDIPHGVVCGTLMAETNRITLQKLKGTPNEKLFLKKYATIGRILICEKSSQSDEYYAEAFIDQLAKMTEELHIPKLSGYGITPAHLDAIASKTSNKNNPVKLEKEELIEILKKRL